MGFAERFLAGTFNRPHHEIVDHRVYAICSDGDLMEGLSYEAASLAGTNGARQARLLLRRQPHHDRRHDLDLVHRGSRARFEALGWHVQTVADVNDLDALREAIAKAQAETARPSIIIVRSHIAYRRAARGRHGEGARLAARRGRGRGDEGGARLGPRQALLRPGRGLRAHERGRARQRARDGSGSSASRTGRRRSRASASAGTPPGPAASAPGSCPSSRRARTSRRATPARR